MAKKQVDPTPEHFDSYEAAAEFWDTHDTTDYLDEFCTIEVTSEFGNGSCFQVTLPLAK